MKQVLTIRSHSGISGDMLLAGLAVLALAKENIAPDSPAGQTWLNSLTDAVMPEPGQCLSLGRRAVNGIMGWQAQVDLPVAHEHRHLSDIQALIAGSQLCEAAKQAANACFELLASCEAQAHGMNPGDVHFHEVGALDSILDICICCELYQRLDAPLLVASPLPVADGDIVCAHGILAAPAPAVLTLLQGVPVYPFAGEARPGELVTPTGIALLLSLGVDFGPWPAFRLEQSCLVYGSREFRGAANGVIFALGESF